MHLLIHFLRHLFKPLFTKDEIAGAMYLNNFNQKEAEKWLAEDEKLIKPRRIQAIMHLRVRAAEEASFVPSEILNGVVGPSPEFGSGVRLHD